MDDYLKLIADIPLEYVVLGALIERITGRTYFDYMREFVYAPAHMPDTGHDELDLPDARRAVGYTRQNWHGPEDGRLRSNEFIYAVKGSPAEHCFSTVDDLFSFFQAFEAGRLLNQDLMEACLTTYAEAEQPGVNYGYGFQIIDGAGMVVSWATAGGLSAGMHLR